MSDSCVSLVLWNMNNECTLIRYSHEKADIPGICVMYRHNTAPTTTNAKLDRKVWVVFVIDRQQVNILYKISTIYQHNIYVFKNKTNLNKLYKPTITVLKYILKGAT